MVCTQSAVSFVSFTGTATTPKWTYQNASMSTMTFVNYASGSSLVHVAVAWLSVDDPQWYLTSFDPNSATGTPEWTVPLDPSGQNGAAVAIASSGESVIVVLSQLAVSVVNGAVHWTLPSSTPFTPFAFTDPLVPDTVLLLANTGTSVLTGSVSSGVFLTPLDLYDVTSGPVSATAVNVQYSELPMGSNTPQLSGSVVMVAVLSGSTLHFVNVAAQLVEGYFYYDNPVLGTTVKVAGNPAANVMGRLLYQTQVETGAVALATGWLQPTAIDPTVDGAVVYAAGISNAMAIDRNGNVVWELPPTYGTISNSIPFFNNLVLFVLSSTSFGVFDAIAQRVVTTLSIPTACIDNTTSEAPAITTYLVDSKKQNLYFVAGVACVFRVDASATLTAIASRVAGVVNNVVLDEDNGVILGITSSQVYAVALNQTFERMVFSTTNTIRTVVPSSTIAAPSTLGKWLNPVIYIFLYGQLVAVDISSATDPIVWSCASSLAGNGMYQFYDNSLYLVDSVLGLCRLTVDASASSSERVKWCVLQNDVVNGYEFSNLVISENGIIMLTISSYLHARQADTGRPAWNLKGRVLLPLSMYSASQLLIDNDHYILLVVCDENIFGMDILGVGRTLFNFPVTNEVNVYYSDGTVYASSIYASKGVYGLPLPAIITQRRNDYPTPAPTEAFNNETLPPGYHPLPTPAPTAGPTLQRTSLLSSGSLIRFL